jgi:hypothetical protein
MPQGRDRVQPCRLEGREAAEDHPRQRREEEGDKYDPAVEDKGRLEHCRQPHRSVRGEGDADQPPNEERTAAWTFSPKQVHGLAVAEPGKERDPS